MKIHSVNDKTLKLYGVEQAQVIGKTIADFSSPHCPLDTVPDILAKVCAGESQLFEWQGCNPNNGQIFDIEVYLRKVVLHGEDVILASVRDITERKLIQEALRKSESEFRTIFESAGIGIAMVDTGKHPINANPA
ncbi:MAG TPA: PAS domain S-box protein, partial [Armatimonadota bacterium]|nr:PAS domain S-box protein [Armatimonadota bacterium]